MTVNLHGVYGEIPADDTIDRLIDDIAQLRQQLNQLQPTGEHDRDTYNAWWTIGMTEQALWKIQRRLGRLAGLSVSS